MLCNSRLQYTIIYYHERVKNTNVNPKLFPVFENLCNKSTTFQNNELSKLCSSFIFLNNQ